MDKFTYLVTFQCIPERHGLIFTVLEMFMSLIALGLLLFLAIVGFKRLRDIQKVDKYDINNDQQTFCVISLNMVRWSIFICLLSSYDLLNYIFAFALGSNYR